VVSSPSVDCVALDSCELTRLVTYASKFARTFASALTERGWPLIDSPSRRRKARRAASDDSYSQNPNELGLPVSWILFQTTVFSIAIRICRNTRSLIWSVMFPMNNETRGCGGTIGAGAAEGVVVAGVPYDNSKLIQEKSERRKYYIKLTMERNGMARAEGT
jgi:hypothetical protein